MLGRALGRSKLLIQGAGVAGLALAGQCQKNGIPFTLVEAATALPTGDAGIVLPFNAVQTMERLDLLEPLSPYMHPITRMSYTTSDDVMLGQRDLTKGVFQDAKSYTIRRSNLLGALQEQLYSKVHFGVQVQSAEKTAKGVEVRFKEDTLPPATYDAVVGADGIRSQIRTLAFPANPIADHGYTTFGWTTRLNKAEISATHMIDRHCSFMMYPLDPYTVYCFAIYVDNDKSLMAENPLYALRRYFKSFKGEAKAVIDSLNNETDVHVGRLESLEDVQTSKGPFLLIGNAGHATTPWLAQDAAKAFEDVECITALLKDCTIDDSLKLYQAFREPHVGRIHTASKLQQEKILDLNRPGFCHDRTLSKIIQEGPLNVLGWEWLQRQDYPEALKDFLEKHTLSVSTHSLSRRRF